MNDKTMLVLLLFDLLSIVHGQAGMPTVSPCPLINTNFEHMKDKIHHKDVANWTVCSDLCIQRENCHFWTLRKTNCATMTSYEGTSNNLNAISGDVDCTGEFYAMLMQHSISPSSSASSSSSSSSSSSLTTATPLRCNPASDNIDWYCCAATACDLGEGPCNFNIDCSGDLKCAVQNCVAGTDDMKCCGNLQQSKLMLSFPDRCKNVLIFCRL